MASLFSGFDRREKNYIRQKIMANALVFDSNFYDEPDCNVCRFLSSYKIGGVFKIDCSSIWVTIIGCLHQV